MIVSCAYLRMERVHGLTGVLSCSGACFLVPRSFPSEIFNSVSSAGNVCADAEGEDGQAASDEEGTRQACWTLS